jgi:transcriptional regulator with XRE-family HTH domain
MTTKHYLSADYRILSWRQCFDFWRVANRLRYRDIALAAGVSVQGVERWRRPGAKGPRLEQLQRLEQWRPGLVWMLFAPVLLASDRAAARLLRDRNFASKLGQGRRALLPSRELVSDGHPIGRGRRTQGGLPEPPEGAALRLRDALADRLDRG